MYCLNVSVAFECPFLEQRAHFWKFRLFAVPIFGIMFPKMEHMTAVCPTDLWFLPFIGTPDHNIKSAQTFNTNTHWSVTNSTSVSEWGALWQFRAIYVNVSVFGSKVPYVEMGNL